MRAPSTHVQKRMPDGAKRRAASPALEGEAFGGHNTREAEKSGKRTDRCQSSATTGRTPIDEAKNCEAENEANVKDKDAVETEEYFEMVDNDHQSDIFLAGSGNTVHYSASPGTWRAPTTTS